MSEDELHELRLAWNAANRAFRRKPSEETKEQLKHTSAAYTLARYHWDKENG